MRGTLSSLIAVAFAALQMTTLVAFAPFQAQLPSAIMQSYTLMKTINTSTLHAITETNQRQEVMNPYVELHSNNPNAIVTECNDTAESYSEEHEGDVENGEIHSGGDQNSHDDCENDVTDVNSTQRRVLAARLLHQNASTSRSRSACVSESQAKRVSDKNTSAGPRREGSATRARNNGNGSSGLLLKNVKNNAIAAAVAKKKSSESNNSMCALNLGNNSLTVDKSIIQSVVDEMIDAKNKEKWNMGILGSKTQDIPFSSQYVELRDMGYLTVPTKPSPGSVLIDKSFRTISMQLKDRIKDHTIVRVATRRDDLEIAKLRLSVFSDFSPEIRRQFRSKSCEVLGNRRMKGATCLVATVNYRDAGLQFELDEESCPHNWIIGSVECSTHEFAGTQLGLRRPVGSVLYVTEVAVAPKARRAGTGTKLLLGIDKLARIRNVETVYLHVDVENSSALKLYQKSGYEILDSQNPIYYEFTAKLNLHDGATKGRSHYLLHKKITRHQTWIESESLSKTCDRGTLGFDVSDLFE